MTWVMRRGCTPDRKLSPQLWAFQPTQLTVWACLQMKPRRCSIPCRSPTPSATCSAPWAQQSSLHWLVRHCLVSIFVKHAKTMKKSLAVAAKKNSAVPTAPVVDGSCAHSRYLQPQESLTCAPLSPRHWFLTSECLFNVCAATESFRKQILTLYCRKAM